MVYFCSREMLASPLKVCMPPAACQVEPEVSSLFSSSSTSRQPIFARWYSTLAPTTPPPMTTALAELFISAHPPTAGAATDNSATVTSGPAVSPKGRPVAVSHSRT